MHKLTCTLTLAECDRTGNEMGVTFSASGSTLLDPVTFKSLKKASRQAFDDLDVSLAGQAGVLLDREDRAEPDKDEPEMMSKDEVHQLPSSKEVKEPIMSEEPHEPKTKKISKVVSTDDIG